MVEIKAPTVTKGSVGIISQIIATLLLVAATALLAYSFIAEHWLDVTVTKHTLLNQWASQTPSAQINKILQNALVADPTFTTHSRGLFQTCYNLDETDITWPYMTPYDNQMNGFSGNFCMSEAGYEINPRPETASYGYYYQLRVQLMRCHFAFMCAAIFCTTVSAIVNALSCCCFRIRLLITASIVAMAGTFFASGAIAFWHATMYLEHTLIDQKGFFYYYSSRPIIYQLFLNAMSEAYGYCYILSWVSVGVSLVGAILYMVSAIKITGALKDADVNELEREQEAEDIPPLKSEKEIKEKQKQKEKEKAKQEEEAKKKEEEEKKAAEKASSIANYPGFYYGGENVTNYPSSCYGAPGYAGYPAVGNYPYAPYSQTPYVNPMYALPVIAPAYAMPVDRQALEEAIEDAVEEAEGEETEREEEEEEEREREEEEEREERDAGYTRHYY